MTTFVVVAVAVWLIGYYISLRLHPYTACPSCRGNGGRHYGMVFGRYWRPCHACDGRGRRQRWGARRIGRGMPRYKRPTGRQAPRTIEFPTEWRNP